MKNEEGTTAMMRLPRNLTTKRLRITAAVAVVVVTSAGPLLAQLPQIHLDSIFPPGAKVGTRVEVVIKGSDLDGPASLYFSHPGITAKQKFAPPSEFYPDGQPLPGQFTVAIVDNVPGGLVECRVIGRYGISNPRLFAVGHLHDIAEQAAHNSPEQAMQVAVGTTINGSTKEDDVDYYKFSAQKGQRILIDCWGHRIDSRIDPTLVLLDRTGKELKRAGDTDRRDALLDFVAPANGDYVLGLYDFLYRGGDEYFYRLSIHSGPHLDYIFPPAGPAGSREKYTLYGRNLPGSRPAEGVILDGIQLEKLLVDIHLPGDEQARCGLLFGSLIEPHESLIDAQDFRLTSPEGTSGPVLVGYAIAPVVLEQEPNNNQASQAQKVAVPCEYVGQFYPRQDRDWISFEAHKGEVYWIEVISQRLGLETDPYLRVEKITKNDKGEENVSIVKEADDGGHGGAKADPVFSTLTSDPKLRFQADQDALYRVLVRDLYGDSRDDPRHVYRLVIRHQQDDFRLVVVPKSIAPPTRKQPAVAMAPVLRRGGSAILAVTVDRRDGFTGEIDIRAEGLPPGVTCLGCTISGGANATTLILTAAVDASAWTGPIRIAGRAKIDGKQAVRYARSGVLVWPAANKQVQSRLSRDLTLAVIEKEMVPATITVGDGKLVETARGGSVELPVKVTRHGDFQGEVKLTALDVANEMKPKDITIAAGATEGKVQLALANKKLSTGVYTFYLESNAKLKYSRNPDAVKQAVQHQDRFARIVDQVSAQVRQAAAAKAATDKAAQQATEQVKQATAAQKSSDKLVSNTAAASKSAAGAAADAAKAQAHAKMAVVAAEKAAAEASAQVKQAAEKKTAADKAANDAVDKAKTAADAKAATDKALADRQAKAKAAMDAKAAADKAHQETGEKLKRAEAQKKEIDKKVKDQKKAAAPKDVDVALVSTPIRIRIVSTPVTLNVSAPSPVKQGAKIEVPVTIERKYGFAGPVEITVQLPKGVKGISVGKLNIAKDQTQGKLQLAIANDAKPGDHRITIRAMATFNKIKSEPLKQITLKVEKAPPPAEK